LHNYKLVFSYTGTHFFGSQYQPGRRTVEGEFSKSIKKALGLPFSFLASGRTDAGVHAAGQVASLRISQKIPPERLLRCLAHCMPPDIVLQNVFLEDFHFHPRFSARLREYHYLYTTSKKSLPFSCSEFVTQIPFNVGFESVNSLLTAIQGTHDFSAFRCLGSTEKSTRKTVFSCDMINDSFVTPFSGSVDVVRFRIVADSFLYRMVRCLMGALFEVMRHPGKAELFLDNLHFGKKVMTYALAPAKGLTLVRVGYENPINGNWERRF
jgi:tRNA pseudouridine38-40 synthase